MTMTMRGSILVIFFSLVRNCDSNPQFPPYIAYRTPPNNETLLIQLETEKPGVRLPTPFDEVDEKTCPGSLKLGISKKLHEYHEYNPAMAVRQPVVLHNVGHTAGKQVVYVTQYEHLDVLHSAPLASQGKTVQNAMVQALDFPLLLESSSFHASPIIHDVNGDGMEDAVVADYDGGIYILGLEHGSHRKRYFHHTQVPRLYVRRDWVEHRVHEIMGTKPEEPPKEEGDEGNKDSEPIHDPFHTYFEYTYGSDKGPDGILRGVTSDVLKQDSSQTKGLTERRGRRVQHTIIHPDNVENADTTHRRLQEVQQENNNERHHEQKVAEQAHGSAKQGSSDPKHEHQDPVPQDTHEHNEASNHEEHQDQPQHNEKHEEPQKPSERRKEEEHRTEPQEAHTGSTEEHHHDANSAEHANPDPHEHHGEVHNHEEHHDAGHVDPVREEQHVEAGHATPEHHEEHPPVDHEEAPQTHHEHEPEQHDQNDHGHDHIDETEAHEHFDHDDTLHHGDHHDDVDMMDAMDDLYRETDHVLDDDAYEEYEEPEEEDEEAEHDFPEEDDFVDEDGHNTDDPDYAMEDFDDYHHGHDYDDMYGGGYNDDHNQYYDSKHYIRVPPHILCQPVLAELPKQYGNTDEREDILFVAVSYYLDEDEYEGFFSYKRFKEKDTGDETELKRGGYVGSAIMSYVLGESARWSGQTHLDMSTDWSAPDNSTLLGALPIHADAHHIGAFAFGSPIVADLDGDGSLEVILGTSMGMIYCFDARTMVAREKWPVQLKFPVESRILVEDVVGDTNLEVFVADTGGNVVALHYDGTRLWNRNLPASIGHQGIVLLSGSSSPTMGDVNGDGKLDIVILMQINDSYVLFALDAATGLDVDGFPISLSNSPLPATSNPDFLHKKLAQPLLVDLHSDQEFLQHYLRRNGTHWNPTSRSKGSSSFGNAPGLHIVQPLGEDLYIIEGGSGCSHKIAIGNEVSAMVQVDDVHGRNRLDLVVATSSGKVLSLETPASFHPLNAWNHGELRSRTNGHAHGYSASQGIFVHPESRHLMDVFGVVVPITFEIFDNRPNIANEPEKRIYKVEIRAGTSSKRTLWRQEYNKTGVYTERVYVRFGPGFYAMSVVMYTSHGLVYEDSFSVSYNVNYLAGFGALLWLPLALASIAIFLCGSKKTNWEDDDFEGDARDGGTGQGILGRSLPT